MKIIQEKDSPLFERKELILEMEVPKTATLPRAEVKKRIAKKFNVKEDLISIQKIKTAFGGKSLKISCNIYKNKKLLDELELIKKKDQPKEVKEQKPQEVKIEEKKEEVKEDAKETKTKE